MNTYDLASPLFLPGRNSLLESLHPKVGETICEIGCGTARNLIKLYSINQNANLVGLDLSSKMIKTAKLKIKKNGLEQKIILYQGLAENFEFEEQIDTFLFLYSLSMISKPNEALICAFNQPDSEIPGFYHAFMRDVAIVKALIVIGFNAFLMVLI